MGRGQLYKDLWIKFFKTMEELYVNGLRWYKVSDGEEGKEDDQKGRQGQIREIRDFYQVCKENGQIRKDLEIMSEI